MKFNKLFFLNIASALVTLLGVLGGFPRLPKSIQKIITYRPIQWLLVYIMLYQGGGDEDILFTFMMTFMLFIIYRILYYFEDKNKDK